MDDLNKARLRRGQRLSFHDKSEDEIEADLREALEAQGRYGRTLTIRRRNSACSYVVQMWLAFGNKGGEHAHLEDAARTLGHRLIGYEVYPSELLLYFEPQDTVNAAIRLDISISGQGTVSDIARCRSDMIGEGLDEANAPQWSSDVLKDLRAALRRPVLELSATNRGTVCMCFGQCEHVYIAPASEAGSAQRETQVFWATTETIGVANTSRLPTPTA